MNPSEVLAAKYNLDLTQPNPIVVAAGGRDELVELWKELGYKVGVEIGVQRGDFAEKMYKNIPGLKYYGVDSWTYYDGYRDINASFKGQAAFDELYETAKKKLAPYGAELIKKFSTDAATDFKEDSVDFVYVDGNHRFESVVADIAAWLPKIRKGGMIAGHDYARINTKALTLHCKDAVDGWTNAHGNQLFVFYKQRSPNWAWFI